MARGIDEAAHQGCVDHYGLTIAVLGEGVLFHRMSKAVSRIREIILDRGSVIVSEYLPDDPPSNQSFLRRNGLIVALSQAVIPIEFPKRQSGTGSSVLHAKKLGVPVIGVLPKHLKTKSMIATKENFAAEGIPLNTIHRTFDFHMPDILMEILPGHLWHNDPTSRQNRYFSTVANRTIQVSGRLSLTEDSIDAMAEIIKQRLRDAIKG